MINRYYSMLNLTEDATDEEIHQRYMSLRATYMEDRFLEGEAGNEAAKRLTQIEDAYREIKSMREEQRFSSSNNSDRYAELQSAIKNVDLSKAQSILDNFNDRNAEWHYLQSVVFYKKGWSNESKKQLEIAINMDGSNQKYKDEYSKLVASINNSTQNNNSGQFTHNSNDPYRDTRGGYNQPQMGGDNCLNFCCQMVACNMLLNCCCNC